MSANWNTPTTSTVYTDVLGNIDERLDDAARMFNGLSPTNLPTGVFRIDGTSNNALQTWNGATWDDEELTVQKLTILSNPQATVTDIQLNDNANIAATQNLNLYIDSDNDATNNFFNWYHNSNDTTGAALLMSLSEAGALAGLVSVTATTFIGTVTVNADLTGHVTSAGNASTVVVAAITGQTNTNTLTGLDEFLVSDGGVIRRVDMNRFITGQATAMTSGLVGTDELLISDAGNLERMDVSVLLSFILAQANAWSAKQTFNGELEINAGYSEDADVTAAGGGIALNTAVASYFHTPTLTSIPTFSFTGAAASGRVTSFILELSNAGSFAPVWPGSVDWPAGELPGFSTGIDAVSFWTRDGGTIWHGQAITIDSKSP